jgi:RNA polymerase primary sigma factor
LLSATEEVQLARRIARGDAEAKRRLVYCSLGLVRAVATTCRGRGVPLADLVQEGMIGLIQAADAFDVCRGVKFSTYAGRLIRYAMLDAIAAANVIPIPATANRQLAAVRRVESELERLERRPASDAAIAERTQLSAATVRSLRAAAQVAASLDEPVGEDGVLLSELVADDRAVDPSESAVEHERCEEVRGMLRLLPERHRDVLVRRYGLDSTREQSHGEIGKSLGVSEARSRQIEAEALRRLRSIAVPE